MSGVLQEIAKQLDDLDDEPGDVPKIKVIGEPRRPDRPYGKRSPPDYGGERSESI